ncbi:plancitoxin-1-like [Ptychodera flava]|uniref:plancitoxin-1-like n=1 Tax=Ptychodera flava TaxID=63121 RepID=UPI00396A9CBD
MVYSLPKFPNPPAYWNQWPSNGDANGQIFLCLTFDGAALYTIRYQIDFYKPHVYSEKVKSPIKPKRDQALISLQTIKPWWDCTECKSDCTDFTNERFINIAKKGESEEEIYAYLTDRLKLSGVYVEAWRRGAGGRLPSCYGQTNRTAHKMYKVENIQNITFTDVRNNDNYRFNTTQDNSKWAVSQDASRPWVCIGDHNRFESQTKKGGGVVCIHDNEVWRQFTDIIFRYEEVIMNEDHECNRTVPIMDKRR